jgi:hypothetical protein
MSEITAQIKLRRDTSANWTSANPVIGAGELVFTSDVFYSGTDFQKVKVGDGSQTWTQLDYLNFAGGGGGVTNSASSGVITMSDGTNLIASHLKQYAETIKIPNNIVLSNNESNAFSRATVQFIDGAAYIGAKDTTKSNNVQLTIDGTNGVSIDDLKNLQNYHYFNDYQEIRSAFEGIAIRLVATVGDVSIESSGVVTNSIPHIGTNNILRSTALSGLTFNNGTLSLNNPVTIVQPTVDQTTTAGTSSSISGVSVSMASSTTYLVEGGFHIGCNNTAGVVFDITLPSGATIFVEVFGRSTSGTAFVRTPIVSSATLTSVGFNLLNNANGHVRFMGTITTSSTSGNSVFGFASATAGQTSTIFKEGSFIKMTKL